MGAPLLGSQAQPFSNQTQQWDRVSLPGGWFTASAAYAAITTKVASVAEPQTSNGATGRCVFRPQSGSSHLYYPLIQGSDGDTANGRLWVWEHDVSCDGSSLSQWSRFLVGQWLFTAGSTVAGVSGGLYAASDLVCSRIADLSTTDRRGDYAGMWQFIQPASDDNCQAMLKVDGLGGMLLEWELRVATGATGVRVLHRAINAG